MSARMQKLQDELGNQLKGARDIAVRCEDEGRDLSAEERETVKRMVEQASATKKEIEGLKADRALLEQVRAFGDSVDLLPEGAKHRSLGGPAPQTSGTVGERFMKSPQWDAFMSRFPHGRIPDSAKGLMSDPVRFAGFKDLITGGSDTSAGALVFTDSRGLLDRGALLRPLTIRDIITTGTTTSDTVSFARVTGFTNAAAPVAEATATSGTHGVKPESALTLEQVDETVKTIAHWIPATKRALSDAGQIRTLIDEFLVYGLQEELEDQIVAGDGTGQNFTGIANVTGVQAQAWDTDIFTTTRKAKTLVRSVGRATPTAFVMNPTDWQTIDLTMDGNDRFFGDGPFGVTQPRLWGLPVVESEAVTAGTAYVGDFRTAVLWDREDISITTTDSHSDFFVRNLIAILAEMRAAFGVLRPSAIVEIDVTA